MDGMFWGVGVIGGPLVLGLAIFLFGMRHRKLTQTERRAADQRAHENWGKEEIR